MKLDFVVIIISYIFLKVKFTFKMEILILVNNIYSKQKIIIKIF